MMPMPHFPSPATTPNASGSLVSTAGRTLPLRHAHVIVDARGGLARLVLQQRFENPHEVPLEITYSLPLPAEAAVSAFSFRIGDRRVVGQVDKKARARARYEEAIATGHTAALVEQERDTLFTQTLGNVPPGTAIEAEIVVDMKLRFLDDARAAGGGAWELRVPTTVAPRYLGEVGRVIDAERVAQDVSATAMPVHMTIEARLDATSASGTNAESPSHPIVAAFESGIEDGRGPHAVVRFQNAEGVSLDRDVVVRWPAARAEVAATAHVERAAGAEHAYALLTITPPRGAIASVPRDLILLLDTSGSMGGLPIEQAKRVSLALIESLAPTDTLEMISFSSSPKPWKRGALPMTPANRAAAIAWLSGLSASGGTEMRDAIVKALAPLRAGAQRQVVLVTDGLIGFEIEIVREILDRLPFGSRVHTVGVGSGINRTLTAGAARAGRGVEVIADAHEDPERVAARLLARTHAPLVTDVTVRGAAVRELGTARAPDLFQGAPVLVTARVAPEGGTVTVEGHGASGPFRCVVELPAAREVQSAGAFEKLFARDRAADLEMFAAGGENVDAALETLGLTHGIATRMTSWIAITEEKTVDETSPFRTERMPHELPYGSSADGFALRPVNMPPPAPSAMSYGSAGPMPGGMGALGGGGAPTGAPPPMRARAGAPLPPPAAAPMPARPSLDMSKSKKEAADDSDAREEKEDSVRTMVRDVPAKPRSILQRILDPLMGRSDQPGEKVAAPKGGLSRRLRGRIVVKRDREIVVVVTIDAAFAWNAQEHGTVTLASGETREVIVRAQPTAGALPAGVSVRLTLEVDGTLDADVVVSLLLGDMEIDLA